jgi:hypothetical protein
VLLFQGQQFWGKVQRLLTNSEYDHVGMVFKDLIIPPYEVMTFESTSSSGICLSPWDFMLKYKWYSYIDK